MNGDHPIAQGVEDFMVTDEQHFPICDRPAGDMLLRGANIDGLTFDTDSGALEGATVSATAWAHTHGEGRFALHADPVLGATRPSREGIGPQYDRAGNTKTEPQRYELARQCFAQGRAVGRGEPQ